MKGTTRAFLKKIENENLKYYTIDEGGSKEYDTITIASFTGAISSIKLSFVFSENVVEIRVSGIENVPLHKKDTLLEGISELYYGYRWVSFDVDRNSISAKINAAVDHDAAADVCHELMHKICGMVGSSVLRTTKQLW